MYFQHFCGQKKDGQHAVLMGLMENFMYRCGHHNLWSFCPADCSPQMSFVVVMCMCHISFQFDQNSNISCSVVCRWSWQLLSCILEANLLQASIRAWILFDVVSKSRLATSRCCSEFWPCMWNEEPQGILHHLWSSHVPESKLVHWPWRRSTRMLYTTFPAPGSARAALLYLRWTIWVALIHNYATWTICMNVYRIMCVPSPIVTSICGCVAEMYSQGPRRYKTWLP